MDTGWPPPELFVSVMNTTGTSRSASARRSASTSMFPLNGCLDDGTSASGMGRSSASAPVYSTFARVVSKCVLFGIVRPRPPTALNRIFSAARPWCVGIRCSNGNSSLTDWRKRSHEAEPA